METPTPLYNHTWYELLNPGAQATLRRLPAPTPPWEALSPWEAVKAMALGARGQPGDVQDRVRMLVYAVVTYAVECEAREARNVAARQAPAWVSNAEFDVTPPDWKEEP